MWIRQRPTPRVAALRSVTDHIHRALAAGLAHQADQFLIRQRRLQPQLPGLPLARPRPLLHCRRPSQEIKQDLRQHRDSPARGSKGSQARVDSRQADQVDLVVRAAVAKSKTRSLPHPRQAAPARPLAVAPRIPTILGGFSGTSCSFAVRRGSGLPLPQTTCLLHLGPG